MEDPFGGAAEADDGPPRRLMRRGTLSASPGEAEAGRYRIVGIDVYKKMSARGGGDVDVEADFQFDRQKSGTSPGEVSASQPSC